MKILPVVSPLFLAATLFGQDQSAQQFAERAAQINMTEAHLGEMAQRKAASQDVKDYGQKIAKDHKDAYQRLKTAASALTVPDGIDAEHQSVIRKFENLSGEQFDKQFRETMVQDHQKAIDLFQRASTNLQNAALKDYASQRLPVLQNHLEMARKLDQQQVSQSTDAAPLDTARPLEPAGTAQQQQPPSSSADRTATDGMTAGATHHATVVSYEPGQSIELKVRDRIGRHVYDISKNQVSGPLPADLKVGSRVTVTEMVDSNGRRSIRIENEQSQQQ